MQLAVEPAKHCASVTGPVVAPRGGVTVTVGPILDPSSSAPVQREPRRETGVDTSWPAFHWFWILPDCVISPLRFSGASGSRLNTALTVALPVRVKLQGEVVPEQLPPVQPAK